MDRMWMLAAAPLLLMAVMCCVGTLRATGDLFSITWIVILVNALATGLCLLLMVFTGWWRGYCQLTQPGILATVVFASLDALIPTTLVVLLWLLARSLKGGSLLSF